MNNTSFSSIQCCHKSELFVRPLKTVVRINLKKLLIILSLIIAFDGVSQVNLDSLWGVWNNPEEADTSKLKAMNKICREGYIFTQPDSALYFARLQYNLAEEKDDKKYMAEALNLQGVSCTILGDYSKALDYHMRGLEINRQIENERGVAAALSNIGGIYTSLGDYKNALDHHTRSLVILAELGNKPGISKSLSKIGTVYLFQGDYALALDYQKRSLRVKEEIGDKIGVSKSLNSIGLIYYTRGDYANAIDYYTRSLKINEEMGDYLGAATSLNNIGMIYHDLEDFTMAIDYHNRSLKIGEEIGDKRGILSALNNIGISYFELGDYTKAMDYYTRGIKISEEIGDKEGIVISLCNMSKSYYYLGNYNEAKVKGEKALAIAREIRSVGGINSITDILWKVNKSLGRYKHALEMHELYITTLDSIQSEENLKAVIRQEYKYAYEKQAVADSIKNAEANKVKDAQLSAEMAKTEQQRQQKYFVYASLALTLLFGGIILNRFRVTSKQKLKNLELEKQISIEKLESATQNIREKLQIIEKLENEIYSESADSEKYRMERISILFNENNYLDESKWNEVIFHYDKMNGNFTKVIKQKFDRVTKEDIKLLILVKMGFLNKEISAIRGTTIDATKKRKQRLRAKIGIKDLNNV